MPCSSPELRTHTGGTHRHTYPCVHPHLCVYTHAFAEPRVPTLTIPFPNSTEAMMEGEAVTSLPLDIRACWGPSGKQLGRVVCAALGPLLIPLLDHRHSGDSCRISLIQEQSVCCAVKGPCARPSRGKFHDSEFGRMSGKSLSARCQTLGFS